MSNAGLCYDFEREDPMRQVKRLAYIILLNIIVSAITVFVVLTLWERNHAPFSSDSTSVVIVVTPTPASLQHTAIQTDSGVNTAVAAMGTITVTLQANPEIVLLTYQVKKGDTLGALAVEFNVSVADILTVNGLTDPNSIYEGQILHIPSAPLPTTTPTPTPTRDISATPRPSITPTHPPTATATITPTGQAPQLIIQTVIGAGVLANEHIVLERTGEGFLLLAGWQVKDGSGNTYTFPQLTLYKGGMINLNSRAGEDTVQDLFWGLTSAIWSSGKTVFLYDAQNVLRASYIIP